MSRKINQKLWQESRQKMVLVAWDNSSRDGEQCLEMRDSQEAKMTVPGNGHGHGLRRRKLHMILRFCI